MIKILYALQENLKETNATLIAYLNDDTISIDERWEALSIASSIGLGNLDYRTEFGLERDDEFLYNGPCYMSRNETRSVVNILETLQSSKEFDMTDEEVITFKKYCLAGAYTRMQFDW